ncbi:hypothetical protein Sj15T_31880 [Sphingobium sp. TA15]|nr:hypothetical protein Sj15T_31880 [Sphingobium sp. TA15]
MEADTDTRVTPVKFLEREVKAACRQRDDHSHLQLAPFPFVNGSSEQDGLTELMHARGRLFKEELSSIGELNPARTSIENAKADAMLQELNPPRQR